MNSFIRINVDQDCRLDELLRERFAFSRRNLNLCKKEGRFTLNGSPLSSDVELHVGDELLFYFAKDEETNYKPVPCNLKVIYEDELLLIIDKPIGYIIHSDGTEECRQAFPHTVNNFVAFYYQQTGQKHAVYNLHRLDQGTSGCLLYCKQPYLVSCFSRAMENKEIKRSYLAVVEGVMRNSRTIDKPIGRDRHVSNRFRVSPTGKPALTEVTPLKHDKSHTLVSCRLQTGRTHQIRVHLASIGHPVVGDEVYGNEKNKRMLLHSHEVEFFNPLVNEMIKVTCQPDDCFSL